MDIINFGFQILIIAHNPIEVLLFPETAASVKHTVDLERSGTLKCADNILETVVLLRVGFWQRLNQYVAMIGHNHICVKHEGFLVPG